MISSLTQPNEKTLLLIIPYIKKRKHYKEMQIVRQDKDAIILIFLLMH